MDLVNEVGHRSVLAPLQIEVAVRSSVMSILIMRTWQTGLRAKADFLELDCVCIEPMSCYLRLTPCGLISSG